jgi:hypothetical protein
MDEFCRSPTLLHPMEKCMGSEQKLPDLNVRGSGTISGKALSSNYRQRLTISRAGFESHVTSHR